MAYSYSTLDLDIIAVTGMKGGKCVMGIDGNDRIRRPIYRTEEESCCWPRGTQISVGNRYRFTLLPGSSGSSGTSYPHCYEDTLVLYTFQYVGKTDKTERYARLQAKALTTPEQIFPQAKYGRYVMENTMCHSVGVLRCMEGNLGVGPSQTNESKNRLLIGLPGRSDYSLPITGFTHDLPPRLMNKQSGFFSQSNNEALVLLGLGRPWDNNGEFNPARCYVIVLNVFFNENLGASSYESLNSYRPSYVQSTVPSYSRGSVQSMRSYSSQSRHRESSFMDPWSWSNQPATYAHSRQHAHRGQHAPPNRGDSWWDLQNWCSIL